MIYPQQKAYKEAKAKYDNRYELSGARQGTILDAWEGDLEDEDLERYAEIVTRMEFEIGLPQASLAYHVAEKALLQWGLEYCRNHADYARVADIVEDMLNSYRITARKRACETLLRLGAFDKE